MDDASQSASETAAPAAAPFDLNTSPSHLLHRAQQAAGDRFVEAFGGAGLTLRQFAVLAAVAAREGLSQSDLVKATGVDRSTLAEMVTRMTTRGLVARARNAQDARANAVSLTDEGRALLARAYPLIGEVDAQVMALLPKSRREGFVELLTRLAFAEPPAPGKAEADAPTPKAKKKKDKGKDKKKKKKK